ncbi:hypothetical protein PCL1606_08480 [Pseudomonas chlororaphis]|uniref:Uncharacterized protein n=1 Tax=Pseudomonas chlororaphis TaxID=587753 RepID=A0A0D5XUA2_9PSED|nr:hypothetical protein PCL1606_08480 [Pseudomonas chlororaphis]
MRTDAHTQQTNTCQTPDARFHAIPHCGWGPVDKTGKAQAGSATGYQAQDLFIERPAGYFPAFPQAIKKGDPSAPPWNFVRARRL